MKTALFRLPKDPDTLCAAQAECSVRELIDAIIAMHGSVNSIVVFDAD